MLGRRIQSVRKTPAKKKWQKELNNENDDENDYLRCDDATSIAKEDSEKDGGGGSASNKKFSTDSESDGDDNGVEGTCKKKKFAWMDSDEDDVPDGDSEEEEVEFKASRPARPCNAKITSSKESIPKSEIIRVSPHRSRSRGKSPRRLLPRGRRMSPSPERHAPSSPATASTAFAKSFTNPSDIAAAQAIRAAALLLMGIDPRASSEVDKVPQSQQTEWNEEYIAPTAATDQASIMSVHDEGHEQHPQHFPTGTLPMYPGGIAFASGPSDSTPPDAVPAEFRAMLDTAYNAMLEAVSDTDQASYPRDTTWNRDSGLNDRYHGRIKKYTEMDSGGGYGFIDCDETKIRFGRDVYIHAKQMQGLRVGDYVVFSITKNSKGEPQARAVMKQEDEAVLPSVHWDQGTVMASPGEEQSEASGMMSEEQARKFQKHLRKQK